jgi:hypothetical protein
VYNFHITIHFEIITSIFLTPEKAHAPFLQSFSQQNQKTMTLNKQPPLPPPLVSLMVKKTSQTLPKIIGWKK